MRSASNILVRMIMYCGDYTSLRPVARVVGFSGSPNPAGSGARALGAGWVFIGYWVADDASAAPCDTEGPIQLETPKISVVISHPEPARG